MELHFNLDGVEKGAYVSNVIFIDLNCVVLVNLISFFNVMAGTNVLVINTLLIPKVWTANTPNANGNINVKAAPRRESSILFACCCVKRDREREKQKNRKTEKVKK